MNSVWNSIAPYVIGKERRGDVPPCKYDELFLQGGRFSGKSYFASVIVWLTLMCDTEKNAVVVRKVGASIKKSCWVQMERVRKRLGLFDWKPNDTKFTYTNRKTGQLIYFVGLDDEEKVRSITVDHGYLSLVWFEEAMQFSSMEEIDQAVASILRGGADSEDANQSSDGSTDDTDGDSEDVGDMEYMTILTYNPPKSSFDWINREAVMGATKPKRLTHKSTYLTMPKKWLGRKALSDIEDKKRRKPEQYRHMYLGVVTGTGSEYFKNIRIRPITDAEIAAFEYFNMGIDWGYNDPNVFLKTYVRDGKMFIFDEIYQDELPSNGENKYVAFARMVKEHTKDCPFDPIYCDAQDKGGMAVFKMPQFLIPVYDAPKQGMNNRERGYGYMQGLDEIVIDPVRCPHSAKAFMTFEAAPAPGGTGWLDKPGCRNDHCPDCARYSEWQNIRNDSRNEDDLPELPDIGDSEDDEDFSWMSEDDSSDFQAFGIDDD